MTLLRLVQVVELLFLLAITTTATSSSPSNVEDETSSSLPHQHLRTAKEHERSVIEMMGGWNNDPSERGGWNNDPSNSGETESEDDEKLNTEININFDTTPWWEKPTCEDDKLQLIMFLETDFTTENNDEYDYDGGILIYEHNSEEYIWSRNNAPIGPINGSDQICLDDTPTACYEIYYYYIGSTLFPNGGFYVDVDGTNLIDIRQNDLEASAGLYGRMEYFGSYYGNGCIDVYGNLYGPLDSVSSGAAYIIENGGSGGGGSGGNGNDDDNSIAPESINDTRHCNDNPYMIQLDMEFQADEWADEDNAIKLRAGGEDDDYIWKYEIGSFKKNKQYRWSTCVDQRECNIFEFHDEEGNLRNSFMKLYVDGVIVLDVDDDDDGRFFRQTPVQYMVDVGSC